MFFDELCYVKHIHKGFFFQCNAFIKVKTFIYVERKSREF